MLADERVIHAVMEKAARRAGLSGCASTSPTPASIATAKDSDEDLARDGLFPDSLEEAEDASVSFFQKSEASAALIDFVLEKGPHPKAILTRFVWLADKIRPEKLGQMSGRDWAKILDESPWAWHARDKAMREQVRRAVGYRSDLVLPTQKSSTSRARMALAAKGNKHRANSVAP